MAGPLDVGDRWNATLYSLIKTHKIPALTGVPGHAGYRAGSRARVPAGAAKSPDRPALA